MLQGRWIGQNKFQTVLTKEEGKRGNHRSRRLEYSWQNGGIGSKFGRTFHTSWQCQ